MAEPNLAQRLGHAADARLVVINADDLGSCHSANVGVYECLATGTVTSATLMVPCPWAREASSRYRGEDVGVHLTLNAEYPLYRWGPITYAPSLLGGDGGFPRTVEDVWDHADLDEVRRECRAQIERAILWGFDVSHLDAHMGTLQMRAEFFDVYLDLALEFGLPLRMSSPNAERYLGFPARAVAAEAGIVFTDHFRYWGGVGSRQLFEKDIATLRPGVTELLLHPAVDSAELRSLASDDWESRVDDHRMICGEDWVRRSLEEAGATLIGYRARCASWPDLVAEQVTATATTTIANVSVLTGRLHGQDRFDITLSADGIEICRPGRPTQHMAWDRVSEWEIEERKRDVVLTLRGHGATTPLIVPGWSVDDLAAVMRDVTAGSGPDGPVDEYMDAAAVAVGSNLTTLDKPVTVVAEVVAEPVAEPIFVPPVVAEPVFVAPVVEPVAEVVAEPVAEPVAEVVAEVVAEPVFVPPVVAEPVFIPPVVAEVVAEPVAEVVAEPVAEVVAEPVAEVVAEPVAEVVAEVVAEPVFVPPVVAEPVFVAPDVEPVAQVVAEPVVEPVAEVVAEPVAEVEVEVVAEVVAEPVFVPPVVAEPVFVPPVVPEPVAEVVAKPVAEVVAELVVEPVAEVAAEPVVQPVFVPPVVAEPVFVPPVVPEPVVEPVAEVVAEPVAVVAEPIFVPQVVAEPVFVPPVIADEPHQTYEALVPVATPEPAESLASARGRHRRRRNPPWKLILTVGLLCLVAAAVTLVLLQSAGVINWSFLGPTS